MFSPRGITSPRVGDRSARDAPEEDEEMNAKENEKYEKKVRKTFKLVQKHGEADSILKLRDKICNLDVFRQKVQARPGVCSVSGKS